MDFIYTVLRNSDTSHPTLLSSLVPKIQSGGEEESCGMTEGGNLPCAELLPYAVRTTYQI